MSDIDLDALSRKYAEERAKRLRVDANNQYQSLTGKFAAFDTDPNALPDFDREPVTRTVDALIIGGGFGGLLAAVQLAKRGITDIVIVEKGADFGGTWYWNRYPGIRCDVDAYIYLPLLEETGFVPSEKYARGAEIHQQCRLLAEKYELYARALFQSLVRTLVWNHERQRWLGTTNRGDLIEARFVISATGLYSSPKLPGIPDIENFEGPSFHTSRWDYGVTGGDATGGLIGLRGKRVGIIGTGSTGIQCVPAVAEYADHLYLFQRTPCSVDIRGNRPTDIEWFRSQPPGWQRQRMMNFTLWTSGVLQEEDMVNDSMTDLFRKADAGETKALDAEAKQRAEILKMEIVRKRIDAIVRDPVTAEALKPYYHYFCKRPGFSDDYLDVFNRANVTLVDTAGKGVERVTASGLVADGVEYPLDCIVYATGFDFMTSYTRETGISVTGRDGWSLDSAWANGTRTLFGMQAHGFPNFFMLSVVQAGISLNYLHTADTQAIYIADLVAHCMEAGMGAVEPTREAEDRWVSQCRELSAARREFHATCTPGYLNFEGAAAERADLNAPYGGGPVDYFEQLARMTRARFNDGLSFEALS
ncbi:flavin-containing monooxygenase [Hephaestia sp. GCM10023244]|uniref:flavin-containing monooxygenase n=1 Tax=unclassified Hephaestia TaxID=2631281 RepID=UPI002077122D|nr:NAD(P)/FAD-dependent oxidoreductase [Hephaestia sp. MAHUQ-44]MCM8731604.1 NAD(P)/FAD-dependent oxidoreductase [Hephaestia sp. MAHUQ-44]